MKVVKSSEGNLFQAELAKLANTAGEWWSTGSGFHQEQTTRDKAKCSQVEAHLYWRLPTSPDERTECSQTRNSQARCCFRELSWTRDSVITSSHMSECAVPWNSCCSVPRSTYSHRTSTIMEVSGGAGGLEKNELPEGHTVLAMLLAGEEWTAFRPLPDKCWNGKSLRLKAYVKWKLVYEVVMLQMTTQATNR